MSNGSCSYIDFPASCDSLGIHCSMRLTVAQCHYVVSLLMNYSEPCSLSYTYRRKQAESRVANAIARRHIESIRSLHTAADNNRLIKNFHPQQSAHANQRLQQEHHNIQHRRVAVEPEFECRVEWIRQQQHHIESGECEPKSKRRQWRRSRDREERFAAGPATHSAFAIYL